MGKMVLVGEQLLDSEYEAIKDAEEVRWELSGMGYRVTQKGRRVRIYKKSEK